MKKFLGIVFSIFSFLSFPRPALAAIVINEISPTGETEWVELYNDQDQTVDVNGWEVTDEQVGTYHFGVTLSATISAHGYLVVSSPQGKLADGGETLTLYDNQNQPVGSSVAYPSITSGKSYARSPDGSNNWIITATRTENGQNPYTAPTNAPTPTMAPTNTPNPTPTPTLKPTSTPTPTKKPSPTPTPTPTTEPTITSGTDPEVTTTLSVTPTLTPSPTILGSKTNKIATSDLIIALGLGGSGLVLIIGALVYYLRNRLK